MFELTDLFVDPSSLPGGAFGFIQLLFLMGVYGGFLFYASNLISDGSELLLLIPSMAGVVGSVVLPILGAIPDGLIVLFSGLGDLEVAQEQLSVGVGALAGSTVMLLTIPWVLAVIAGRVNIDDGKASYKPKGGAKHKLNPPGYFDLTKTGIQVNPSIKKNAQIMFITSLAYWLIQGEGFKFDKDSGTNPDAAHAEKFWALGGLIYCAICFVLYILYSFTQTDSEDVKEQINRQRIKAIEHSLVSLWVAYADDFLQEEKEAGKFEVESQQVLLGTSPTDRRFREALRGFFRRHDADGSGFIERDEMKLLLFNINEKLSDGESDELFRRCDANKDGKIDFEEFAAAMKHLVLSRASMRDLHEDQRDFDQEVTSKLGRKDSFKLETRAKEEEKEFEDKENEDNEDEEEEEEEESEVPEDIAMLPRHQQQKRILMRSLYMMLLGTLIVVLFSDPAVDVLSEFGVRTHIPAFYVAFVLAPLASNASELIAAYNYAKKKTRKTITVSLETLLGAGIMNNTLGLAIFLGLIFGRGLAWEFSAETLCIIFVEWVMVGVAMFQVQTVRTGLLVLCLYPISLILVIVLENVANLN